MPPYGEPDWATPGDTNNVTTTQETGTFNPVTSAAAASNRSSSDGSRKRERCFIMLLSFVNMGLAAMMGALGILTLIKYRGNSVDDLTVAFLAVYMVIFATILFLYELIWWGPIAKLNKMYRKNFGFMYGLTGKGLYLVCIAFLCLGLKEKAEDVSSVRGLDWATGIGWLAVGIFHVFIACIWPELVDVYRPPTAGLTGSQTDHVV